MMTRQKTLTVALPTRSAWRSAGVRALIALAAVLLVLLLAAARAQALGLPDVAALFGSPLAWSAGIMAIVAFTRANILKGITGAAVLLLTFGVGIAGALIAWSGVLARLFGIHLDGSLMDAVIFGVAAAGMAAGLWDAGTGVIAASGKAIAKANAAQLELVRAAAQPLALTTAAVPAGVAQVNPGALTDYLLSLIRARFGAAVPAFAWGILETLAREFAGQALTEDVRAAIQRRLLDLLAAAGAGGQDL